MNYLALCKELHRQIRAGEGIPGTLPTAVTGQTDKLLIDIVAWIAQAWIEIQENQRNWRWMIDEAVGVETLLTIGTSTITLLGATSDFDELRPYQQCGKAYILIYDNSVGVTDQQPLYILPWREFSGYYTRGQIAATPGRPQYAAIAPDGVMYFWPTADKTYKLKYEYRKTNQSLTADGTTPLMPAKYHMLIVYLALCYYARSNENNNIQKWLGNGLQDRRAPSSPLVQLFQSLCAEQLPPITFLGEI